MHSVSSKEDPGSPPSDSAPEYLRLPMDPRHYVVNGTPRHPYPTGSTILSVRMNPINPVQRRGSDSDIAELTSYFS